MRKNPLAESIRDLYHEIFAYLKILGELLRLKMLENFSRYFSRLFSSMIGLYFFMISLFFISIAVAIWINRAIEDLALSFVIIAGFYLLLSILTILLRKYLLTRPMIKKLKKALFADIINKESGDDTK